MVYPAIWWKSRVHYYRAERMSDKLITDTVSNNIRNTEEAVLRPQYSPRLLY